MTDSQLAMVAKVAVLVLAVAFAGVGVWVATVPPTAGTGPVACTSEAMQCPDGSWVGRTGPHCEFICPTASSTAGSTSTATGTSGGGFAAYHSGIKGTVMAGPTCPVERNPPDPACADKPVSINIWISRAAAPQQIIATTQSNAQGAFQLSLPPGDYVVGAGGMGMMLPRCANTTATVGPSGYTQVAVGCDTGIR